MTRYNYDESGNLIIKIDKQDLENDEAKGAKTLLGHMDIVSDLIRRLKKWGVKAWRTNGNDPNGDIAVVARDYDAVKEFFNSL